MSGLSGMNFLVIAETFLLKEKSSTKAITFFKSLTSFSLELPEYAQHLIVMLENLLSSNFELGAVNHKSLAFFKEFAVKI